MGFIRAPLPMVINSFFVCTKQTTYGNDDRDRQARVAERRHTRVAKQGLATLEGDARQLMLRNSRLTYT